MIEPGRNAYEIKRQMEVVRADEMKCTYRYNCDAYNRESKTCEKEAGGKYCGIFRQFESGLIKKWKKPI